MLDEVKTGVQKLLAVINICQYKKKAKSHVGHELSTTQKGCSLLQKVLFHLLFHLP